jgi:preprotein translocase subunit SecE
MASIIQRTRSFTQEVVDEIKKVTWPDWPQLKNSTAVVIVFVVIVSLIIFLMDLVVRTVLGFIMNLFSGG